MPRSSYEAFETILKSNAKLLLTCSVPIWRKISNYIKLLLILANNFVWFLWHNSCARTEQVIHEISGLGKPSDQNHKEDYVPSQGDLCVQGGHSDSRSTFCRRHGGRQ
jgi:hypothetical protein